MEIRSLVDWLASQDLPEVGNLGLYALSTVMDLFPGVKVISVGKKAEKVCKKIGVQTVGHLIHPSYHVKGFREQFEAYFIN